MLFGSLILGLEIKYLVSGKLHDTYRVLDVIGGRGLGISSAVSVNASLATHEDALGRRLTARCLGREKSTKMNLVKDLHGYEHNYNDTYFGVLGCETPI